MFKWWKRLKLQQELINAELLRPLPDEPILYGLQELIDYAIDWITLQHSQKKSLYKYTSLYQYMSIYATDILTAEISNFLLWLAGGASLTSGLILEKNNQQGELLEGGEFLAEFMENEAIFNEYFVIENQHLMYRGTVTRDERLKINSYASKNYFQRITPR